MACINPPVKSVDEIIREQRGKARQFAIASARYYRNPKIGGHPISRLWGIDPVLGGRINMWMKEAVKAEQK